MSSAEKFKTQVSRRTTEYQYRCYADERMFCSEFDDMPEDIQAIFGGENGVSLPCDAGGHPGPWCDKCVFGESEETDAWD